MIRFGWLLKYLQNIRETEWNFSICDAYSTPLSFHKSETSMLYHRPVGIRIPPNVELVNVVVIAVTRKLMTICQYNGHSGREFDSELKV